MNLRKIRPWAFYFLAWTLVGLIYFAQNVTRRFYWDDPNPWQDLRYWMVNIYASALLTPLIVWAALDCPTATGATMLGPNVANPVSSLAVHERSTVRAW